jgi:hypothetical protein
MVVVRAKVRERRQAQRQARQAKSKKKNRYVIKVMNEHREGEQFLKSEVRENQRLFATF